VISALEWIWRDPVQVVASEVRAPALQKACEGLIVLRLALGDLDPLMWRAMLHWRRHKVALAPVAGEAAVWEARGADGRTIRLWPRRVTLHSTGEAVVCVMHRQRGFLRGGLVTPQEPTTLSLPSDDWFLRVLPLTSQGAVLSGEPVLGVQVLAAGLRRGLDLRTALRQALPVRPRHMGSPPDGRYRRWLQRQPPARPTAEVSQTLISVLMPVHDPRPEDLAAAIASVRAQSHAQWELCIVDDASTRPAVRRLLQDAADAEPRIRLTRSPANQGVSKATNTALAMAGGAIVAFLDQDDLLTADALAAMAQAFEDPQVMAAYSDEDTVDAEGRPRAPSFKTSFDAERLLSQNFVNHLFCARTGLIRALGGLREGFSGAQDHDLVLRLSLAAPGGVRHVPKVLYHWRRYPGGASLSQRRPQHAATARRAAVEAHLAERGLNAEVSTAPDGFNRLTWPLPAPSPRVRVIIPSKNRADLLTGCLASLLTVTDYDNLEVWVVDNGSTDTDVLAVLARFTADPRVQILTDPSPFNHSALNNLAAQAPGAEILCLLNDDVLVMEPGWLREMTSLAVRPDVGAVGAKLFYPDGRIQHAGVVLGLGGLAVAGHELRGSPAEAVGLQSRLVVTREVDAVTGACLVVERRKYLEVEGLDAEAFPVAFNDVDLCLRLEKRGYRSLWTPHARLIHIESASRNRQDPAARQAQLRLDAERMHARWGERLTAGADYHPALSRKDETFSLA
jgi:GT2 family glycosyltransferase